MPKNMRIMLVLCGAVLAFAITIQASTCWQMRDSALYCSGHKVGEVRNNGVYAGNGKKVGAIRDESIFAANGRRLASVRNEIIYDAKGRKIGTVEQVRKQIRDAVGGMTVVALWVCFIR